MRWKPIKLTLAIGLAFIMLLDNITTWYALQKGAYETNILIAPLFTNLPLFIIFSIIKPLIGFIAVYLIKNPSLSFFLIYTIILILFLRATIINYINYLTPL